MIQRTLADLVLALHFGFIIFVGVGGLLALRWRRAPWLHLPAALWGLFIETTGGVCPLTPLENRLRSAAGAAGYEAGFIEHYLVPLIYLPDPSRDLQLVLAGTVVLANLIVYAIVWRIRARRRDEHT